MKQCDQTVRGLLLNDTFRAAGSTKVGDKDIHWGDGYILTILPLGDRRGNAQKVKVKPELKDSISAQLSNVGWGSVVVLAMDDQWVIDVTVVVDWSDDLPD